MSDNEMRIVIPSYQRSSSINNKSLKTLFDAGYQAEEIDLFVANKQEYDKYKGVVHPNINIIIGVKGLIEIRKFIFDYYDQGQKLLFLDDDIEKIKILTVNDDKETLKDLKDLKSIVWMGFQLCEDHSLKLWGLFTCCNPRFMNNSPEIISTDYKFIIGNFFGCINCKEMNELNVLDIDDFERSIRSYELYGGSVRFNHLAAKTKFLKNEGGAQQDNRIERIHSSIDILMEKYPKMMYVKKKKCGYKKSIILKQLK